MTKENYRQNYQSIQNNNNNSVPASANTPLPKEERTAKKNDETKGLAYRGPLTAEEKQRRRENNLCNYCGEPGHYADTCVKTTKNNEKGGERFGRAAITVASPDSETRKIPWIPFTIHKKDPLVEFATWGLNGQKFTVSALLDSGATASLILPSSEILKSVRIQKYEKAKMLTLVDNQPNPLGRGEISHFVELDIFFKENLGPYTVTFDIAEVAAPEAVLGLNFIKPYGALIDWETCEMKLSKALTPAKGSNTLPLGEKEIFCHQSEILVEAKQAMRELGIEEEEIEMESDKITKRVPEVLHDYLDIFRASNYKSLPPHRTYDHFVELTPNPSMKRLRPYPLSADADRWLKNWIDES
jgi:hypothetical protein